jgi:hypothetical protein
MALKGRGTARGWGSSKGVNFIHVQLGVGVICGVAKVSNRLPAGVTFRSAGAAPVWLCDGGVPDRPEGGL